MELASEIRPAPRANYSPTSTPVLDVFRPLVRHAPDNLGVGEYFFISSSVILGLIAFPALRDVFGAAAGSSNPQLSWIMMFSWPLVALTMACTVHVVGHLVAAIICGFRVTGLRAWLFQKHSSGEWKGPHSGPPIAIGTISLEPKQSQDLRRRLFLLVLGGPVANLILAASLELALHFAAASLFVQFLWHSVALFSLLLGISSLLPDLNSRGNFSDGARCLMLLKNDALAARWMASIGFQHGLNRGQHPREWQASVVANSAAIDDGSRDHVIAQWMAYLWAVERQDISSATRNLEEALAALDRAPAELRDRLFFEAAVFQAWFRDNPKKAGFWASQVRRGKLSKLQQLQLEIALTWAAGRLFDAWEKLGRYFLMLRELPESAGRDSAENTARDWKRQMESRMLTRAWRSMYALSQELHPDSLQAAFAAPDRQEISSW